MRTSICRPGPVLWLAGYQVSGDYCQVCKRPLKQGSCNGGAGDVVRDGAHRTAVRARPDVTQSLRGASR